MVSCPNSAGWARYACGKKNIVPSYEPQESNIVETKNNKNSTDSRL